MNKRTSTVRRDLFVLCITEKNIHARERSAAWIDPANRMTDARIWRAFVQAPRESLPWH
jgi:hypothetical protein